MDAAQGVVRVWPWVWSDPFLLGGMRSPCCCIIILYDYCDMVGVAVGEQYICDAGRALRGARGGRGGDTKEARVCFECAGGNGLGTRP